MVTRAAEKTLRRYAKGFPVVCIAGPRQSGKTTLAKKAFPKKPYFSLEDPDTAYLVKTDPRGFLSAYPGGLVLDEAQYVPEIFLWLKSAVDADPRPGTYIITGSQQFHLLDKVSESLAGRAAMLTLLPFTVKELEKASLKEGDPFSLLLKGFYPPVYDRNILPQDWYSQYLSLYVERDIRSLLEVRDLGQFQLFVKMCASRTGQILNANSLAADCGISHNTARAWIGMLETSGIVYLLRPYYRNFGKRLVKSPKLHFLDSGLLCQLLGIRNREQLFLHPQRGNIFESFVVSELLKHRLNAGLSPDLYMWRDNNGAEIDVLLEEGARITAVEIKSGQTLGPDFFDVFQKWMRYSGSGPRDCRLIYGGNMNGSRQGIRFISWDKAAAAMP
jgi:predicted AAA+ superfamily ATPase